MRERIGAEHSWADAFLSRSEKQILSKLHLIRFHPIEVMRRVRLKKPSGSNPPRFEWPLRAGLESEQRSFHPNDRARAQQSP